MRVLTRRLVTAMSADDDLLAILATAPFHLHVEGEAPVPNSVFDGYVDADQTSKVITVPLPYLVFYSTPGYDRDERLSGQVAGRVLQFQIIGVGDHRDQAKWVLDQARTRLSRKRLNGNLIVRDDTNQPVRREDTYTRPGGEPLFYGIERYAVAT